MTEQRPTLEEALKIQRAADAEKRNYTPEEMVLLQPFLRVTRAEAETLDPALLKLLYNMAANIINIAGIGEEGVVRLVASVAVVMARSYHSPRKKHKAKEDK